MKTIKRSSKKRNTKKYNKKMKIRGGVNSSTTEGLFGNTMQSIIPKRRPKNDGKIRVQFLNPETSTSPYSVISVIKGPTTGVFDYMWYNINDIEEMLSTAMKGLNTNNLQKEKIFNVVHNDTLNDITSEKKKYSDDDEEYYDRSSRRRRDDIFSF
jgi:curli biogenesis system outer membrane secretion channel CsgG